MANPNVETFRKCWSVEPLYFLQTGIRYFSSFYRCKIKLLYLFPHLLIQIWSQNHNFNDLNVFFIVFIHNIAGSVNGQCIRWPLTKTESARAIASSIFAYLSRFKFAIESVMISLITCKIWKKFENTFWNMSIFTFTCMT